MIPYTLAAVDQEFKMYIIKMVESSYLQTMEIRQKCTHQEIQTFQIILAYLPIFILMSFLF